MDNWPFADPPDKSTITVQQVVCGNQPILFVSHEAEGTWQFMPRAPFDGDDGVMTMVTLQSLVELDASLVELADLLPGWEAWRERAGAPWQRQQEPGDWTYF